MAFSNQRAVSDGSLQTIILSIAFFDKTEIHVYVDDVEKFVDVDFIWATSNSIQFPSNLPIDTTVIIRRVTDISEMRHIFTAGAQFTNQTLDEDYTQILHIAQESVEGSYTTELFNDLDMHGYRVRNMGDAELPGDAVPLGQVQEIIQISPDLLRAVRAPQGEGPLPELPPAGTRAGHVLGFDANGWPIGVLPMSGSGTELALDLASSVEGKGANMVAWLRKPLYARMDRVQDRLDALHISPWEEIALVVKPNPNDPSTWDWTPAVQATLNKAFATVKASQMLSANINYCGVVIDGGGYGYQLKSRLQLPNGGGVTFLNGLFFAHSTFTADYLVRMGNSEATGAFRHEKILWDKWIFDCRQKSGGIIVTNSIRCKFFGCTFLRYITDGARTFGNCVEIHFLFCDFGTKPYANTNPAMGDSPEVVGLQVGLRLGSTDNKVIGCIFHRGKSVIIQAQAQHLSQNQFYGYYPWGVAIEVRSSGCTINDNAFGKLGIAVYSPFNNTFTGNMFVMEDMTVDDWGITLIPLSAGETMSGIYIVGNTFRRVNGLIGKSVNYDTTSGTIARVRSSKIRDNLHFRVRETCVTQHRMTQFLSVTSTANFDFSAFIEFGIPAEARTWFMQNSGGASLINAGIDGNLSQITRSSVPVRLTSASNGTLQAFMSVEEAADLS